MKYSGGSALAVEGKYPAVTSALVVAVVISSAGVALAHEGHAHAPAPGPAPASGADGLLPGSIVASFFVAVTGFLAARFM
ncbi:hypothetical protein MPTK1_8g06650 [Marchantia polymorpha subsp. ruderalis]|uniref:Uncharacterized protein n=1 Tax=Marchantia polymorpha TaxID=3197 RepID=A0A2R6XIM0_MARPO|nr:hypothetical protein MARPO_0013s0127 [Marchantia polymorpha]BBN18924.1 hypothetical protein Mp_8g06650 [Marchantia polymorpha subsp. ruderalis]|eukprot:PTQ45922.1 hypothetical protein MARPO_0013s0127 [Marchantia polymorpha]